MDRLLIGQPGTLNATWERDGDQADPGTVTVTVSSDDGSAVVTAAATAGAGFDRSVLLTPAQLARLDRLTAVWTATDGSQLTTYAEVVGGFLFSVARARQRSPLQDEQTYPTSSILFYRTMAEMALEDICGVAFVPRYSRHTASVRSWGFLELPRRRATTIRQITTSSDTGPIPLPSLAGTRIEASGLIFTPTIWNWWGEPIQVAYEHGYQEAPPRIGRAVLELARRWIVESPWDERMTGYKQRDGGELSILTASHTDPFDIPEVVAIADQYGTPLVA